MVADTHAALAEAEVVIAAAEAKLAAAAAAKSSKKSSASTKWLGTASSSSISSISSISSVDAAPADAAAHSNGGGYFTSGGSFRLGLQRPPPRQPPPGVEAAEGGFAGARVTTRVAPGGEEGVPEGGETKAAAAAAAGVVSGGAGSAGLGALSAASGGRERRLAGRESSVLVVGGSDGSGTRSVVALLEKLGVFMVVDDRGTNDVHAEEMGGWPPVVRPVLEAMHGANFALPSVPRNIKEGTVTKMARFLDVMRRRGSQGGRRLREAAVKVSGGAGAGANDPAMTTTDSSSALIPKPAAAFVASGVAYGYKAPVAMLLVPFLAQAYQREGFKFLHVVRDGRDIAFSGNQSPVTKFYANSYADGQAKFKRWAAMPEVRGIQLWSDWNSDVYEWGTAKNAQEDANVEYLKVHTEDLIDVSCY